jgi:1-acyl-sn-glycerol-3-phosphate acyltransferase
MRTIRAIPRTFVTLLSGLIATIFCGMAAIVIGHLRPTSPWVQRLIVAWSQAWLIPAGVKLDVVGLENIDTSHSYVVTANHLSNIDVMVCFVSLPIPIRYLAKKELFRIPILAQAMRAVGIVEVDRQTHGAATIKSVNSQSQSVIERGHSLIIYPEGTRSRDGEPKPFKKGAFTMAASASMPVLPVTLEGTREIWPPVSLRIRPGAVRVVIDPPIPTADLTKSDVEDLRRQVQTQIVGHFRELQALTD